MPEITYESPNEKILGYFRRTSDVAEKWNQGGGTTTQYYDEITVAMKIRDLMMKGVQAERICWTQVSKTFFVIVRNK